jgi:hypothetical protein
MPDGFNYRFWLHAHSHVMLLGWLFNALFANLLAAFVPPDRQPRYRTLFWVLQAAVLGMLLTFPVQGYAAFSIAFSTLHMVAAYVFAWRFLTDTRTVADRFASRWVQWGLWFMVLSSAGPFALGAIKANGLGRTHWYDLAVYFYLHFQYNGWLVFAAAGLFFRWAAANRIPFRTTDAGRFFVCMAAACVPAYALSALWTQPPVWVYAVGLAAAGLQIVGLVFFLRSLRGTAPALRAATGVFTGRLWAVAFWAFLLKTVLQGALAFPAMAQLSYAQRNIVIAYLHLVFIGLLSFFLIGLAAQLRLLNAGSRWVRVGVLFWISSFVLHEVLLVAQPFVPEINVWFYPAMLGVSAAMWLSVVLLGWGSRRLPPTSAGRFE